MPDLRPASAAFWWSDIGDSAADRSRSRWFEVSLLPLLTDLIAHFGACRFTTTALPMWASTCAAVLCALNLAAALLLALRHSPIAGAILPTHSLPINEPSAFPTALMPASSSPSTRQAVVSSE